MRWRPFTDTVATGDADDSTVSRPPPSLDPTRDRNTVAAPPLHVFVERRTPLPNTAADKFLAVPDSQIARLSPNTPDRLGVSGWQDSPDPIRQSYFWDAGHKIQPWARRTRSSHLNIASILAQQFTDFRVGKLRQPHRVTMFEGSQLALGQRYNIQEGTHRTYGSLYEVGAAVPSPSPSRSRDGYPY